MTTPDIDYFLPLSEVAFEILLITPLGAQVGGTAAEGLANQVTRARAQNMDSEDDMIAALYRLLLFADPRRFRARYGALGLAVAVVASRLVAGLLYGITTSDAATYLGVSTH